MEYNLEEFDIKFIEGRIIVSKQKESIVRMTKEGAVECVEKMVELSKMNDEPKAVIFYVESLYIKKDVMRVFSSYPTPKTVVCSGLISPSFLAKNVANMILKMWTRFSTTDMPTYICSTEEEAMVWAYSILSPKS